MDTDKVPFDCLIKQHVIAKLAHEILLSLTTHPTLSNEGIVIRAYELAKIYYDFGITNNWIKVIKIGENKT